MCLLVARYGFANDEDATEHRTRRLFVTRIGHAAAGVCFAASAILTVTALSRAPRSAAPAADPQIGILAERVRSLEDRAQTAEATLRQVAPALERLDRRVVDVDNAARRLGDELAEAEARARAAEAAVERERAARREAVQPAVTRVPRSAWSRPQDRAPRLQRRKSRSWCPSRRSRPSPRQRRRRRAQR